MVRQVELTRRFTASVETRAQIAAGDLAAAERAWEQLVKGVCLGHNGLVVVAHWTRPRHTPDMPDAWRGVIVSGYQDLPELLKLCMESGCRNLRFVATPRSSAPYPTSLSDSLFR